MDGVHVLELYPDHKVDPAVCLLIYDFYTVQILLNEAIVSDHHLQSGNKGVTIRPTLFPLDVRMYQDLCCPRVSIQNTLDTSPYIVDSA